MVERLRKAEPRYRYRTRETPSAGIAMHGEYCTSVSDGKALAVRLQQSSSGTSRNFQCFCSLYPSGHYFRSKGACNYHRRARRRSVSELNLQLAIVLTISNRINYNPITQILWVKLMATDNPRLMRPM